MIVFDEILRMRQKELKHYLAGYLKKMGYDVIRQKGFLYAEGTVPVLLVAHLDTVHQEKPSINDLFGKLRERMIDLRSGKVVFVGGGFILLRKQIEASGKLGTPIFVDEISANTKGYELLFKAACMG